MLMHLRVNQHAMVEEGWHDVVVVCDLPVRAASWDNQQVEWCAVAVDRRVFEGRSVGVELL